MQLHLRRLARPLRQAARRQQQPHRLFQGVVAALPGRPVVLGAGFLAEGVEDFGDGGEAFGGQVGVGFAVALEQAGQAEEPVLEPGIIVLVPVGRGDLGADLLGQLRQAVQVQARRRPASARNSSASSR